MKNSIYTISVVALGLTLMTSVTFAQKKVETDAALQFQSYEKAQMMGDQEEMKKQLLKAKESIDLAAVNPETQKSPKTLFYKGEIYASLAFIGMIDSTFNKSVPADARQIAINAYKESISVSSKYKSDIENTVNTVKQLMHPVGSAAYEAKKFKEAGEAFGLINDFNSILGKVDTVYIYYQGMAAESDGQWDKAASYYQKCAEMNYKPDETYRATAMAYIKGGKNDRAIEFLKHAIEKSPKDKHLYFALGTIAMEMNDDATVLENFKKALEIDPKYSDVHYNLGSYFSSKGADLRQKAADLPPNAKKESDELLAKSLEFYKLAMEPLENYVALQPKDLDVLNSLVKIARALKDTEKEAKYRAMLESAK